MENNKIYNNDYENSTTENNVTSSLSTNEVSSKEDFLEGFIQELADFILYELTFRQILLNSDLTREEKDKYLIERKNKLFEYSISVSKNTDFYKNYLKHILNFIKYNTARKNLAACENPYLNADVTYLINKSEYLVNSKYILEKFNIINIYCNSYGTVTVKFSFNISKGIMLILNSLDEFTYDKDGYFKHYPFTLGKFKKYKLDCIIDKLKKEGIKK